MEKLWNFFSGDLYDPCYYFQAFSKFPGGIPVEFIDDVLSISILIENGQKCYK